jgi:hypothetical protein
MRPALLLICMVYAGLGSDLRVGHNVVLSVPAGRSYWLLSSTRSEAELLFRKYPSHEHQQAAAEPVSLWAISLRAGRGPAVGQ